jgi:homodimeric cytidine deaminase
MQDLDLSLTEQEFITKIPELLSRASTISSPVISNFVVSAAGYGIDGSIYLGANMEFPAMGLDACIHAEEFVVSSAVNRNGLRLLCLAISAFPCGHCRQILAELDGSEHLKVYVMQPLPKNCCSDTIIPDACLRTESKKSLPCLEAQVLGPFSMQDLLPHAFGPLQLGNSQRLLSAQPCCLTLQSPCDADLSSLASLAVDFANRSYSVSPPHRPLIFRSSPARLPIPSLFPHMTLHRREHPAGAAIQAIR